MLLLLDLLGIFKAPKSIKLLAPPALVLVLGSSVLAYLDGSPITNLIWVGIIAGIIGTMALDSVRIPGYLLGYMPLDLPLRFRTKALGLDDKFMLSMMPKVMGYVNNRMASGVPPSKLLNKKGFPSLPVRVIRGFARPTLGEVLEENKVSFWKARLTGYLWHYSNGIAFGIADATLFGRGPWLLTFGFGLTLALVFLMIVKFLVPPMKMGVKLPLVVFLAHIAVIAVLVLIAHDLITASADSQFFFGQLARQSLVYFKFGCNHSWEDSRACDLLCMQVGPSLFWISLPG
jgi:hypothetical protein